MQDRRFLAKAIVLGLSFGSAGAQVVASESLIASTSVDSAFSLEGLVAHDQAASISSDATFAEETFGADSVAGNCDPSGCLADLRIERLDFGDTSGLPFETRGALVQVGNPVPNSSPGQNVTIRLTSTGSAALSSNGCIQVDASTLDCPVGTLSGGQSAARAVEFRPFNPQSTSALLRATVQSTTPDPSPGNNTLAVLSGTRPAAERLARFTRFDPAACPSIAADIEATDPAGVAVGLFPQGPGFFDELIDNGIFLGAPTIASADSAPLSVVILLDNNKATPLAVQQAVKQNVRQAVQAWWADALADGVPLPAFAIAASSSPDGALVFTTDLAALDAQLDAVVSSGGVTRLFDHLDSAASALAAQQGRRAIVAVVASPDGEGSAGFVRELPVARAGIPVYALAQNSRVEPLARHIAHYSKGFRYLADARSPGSLAVVMDAIRSASRLGWQAPSMGEPRRLVQFRQLNASGVPVLLAKGAYGQTATACARACTVTRDLPDRHGRDFVVSLSISPGATPIDFALIEQVPAGLFVTNISDGGQFLAGSNQIRWDGKGVGTARTFTYQANEPFMFGIAQFEPTDSEFSGTISVSGGQRPTCGDAASARIPPHPVDLNAIGLVDAVLLDAFERAWRHGERWPRGEHPVPVAHLTRAGQIRLGTGGNYSRLASAVPPWAGNGAPAGPYSVAATRSAPATYSPGEALTVQLAVQPLLGTRNNAIEEVLPGGWEIVTISDGGVFDSATRTIRWGLFRDAQARVVTYIARPALDASGVAIFSGRYSVDGELREFTGTSQATSVGQPALFFNSFE